MNKFKKILSISGILGGLAATAPIVLATTSCAKKEWTFNSSEEVFTYLEKHAVDVSEPHTFGPAIKSEEDDPVINPEDYKEMYKEDYKFVNENINLQFFINSTFYSVWKETIGQTGEYSWQKFSGFNLKIMDKDTVNLQYTVPGNDKKGDTASNDIKTIYTIKYKNGNLDIRRNIHQNEDHIESIAKFDFDSNFFIQQQYYHFVNVDVSGSINSRTIAFYDDDSQLFKFKGFSISLFDWCNKSLRNIPFVPPEPNIK